MKNLILAGLCLLASVARAAPDHVVLVIEENHSFSQIIGSVDCPTINQWAQSGALLTRSHAVTHPSEPNYLALFAGDTFGSPPDTCPPPGSPFAADNLASLLRAAGLSFVGYSEDLPAAGDTGCADLNPNGYRRKHNSWVDFSKLPADCNQPFSAFPADFSRLPTVAFVVPNLENDMHNGTPTEADAWLRDKLSAYKDWCLTHNSLLIVTWDEDNGAEGNRIPTFILGQGVKVGKIKRKTDHYGVLRTLCGFYGLKAPGLAAHAKPITGIFN
ncbi:MAG TPA: alkaline phosphatase family protein [bacterium]|nr:alkaline phosphatase family protein [bacterium]